MPGPGYNMLIQMVPQSHYSIVCLSCPAISVNNTGHQHLIQWHDLQQTLRCQPHSPITAQQYCICSTCFIHAISSLWNLKKTPLFWVWWYRHEVIQPVTPLKSFFSTMGICNYVRDGQMLNLPSVEALWWCISTGPHVRTHWFLDN